MIKNENQYLHEHIVSDMEAGIDHFYIYDDNSDVPVEEYLKNNCSELLDYCTITVVDDSYNDPNYYRQSVVYNKFLEKYSDETNWCSFTDTDEIWSGDLKKFCKEAEESGIYRLFVPWTVHGCNGHIYRNEDSLKDRFIKSEINLNDWCIDRPGSANMFFGKSIIYCDWELNKNYHYVIHTILPNVIDPETGLYKNPLFFENSESDYWSDIVKKYKNSEFRLDVTLHHYFYRSFEDFLIKISRGYKHSLTVNEDDSWLKHWTSLNRLFMLNNLDPISPDIKALLKKYEIEYVSMKRDPADYTVSYSDLVENPDSPKVKKYKRIVERLNKKYNNEHTNNRNIGIHREESSKENN